MNDSMHVLPRRRWLEMAAGEIVSLLALGGFLVTLAFWARLLLELA